MAYQDKEREREYQREYQREYRIKNKGRFNDYIREFMRAYRIKNKEKYVEYRREYNHKYYIKNKEDSRERYQRRRARKQGAGGTYSVEDIQNLFNTQEGLCFYCGETLHEYHIEHKTPLSRGGSNDVLNIALSCQSCNLRKHTKTAEEFIEYLEAVKCYLITI